MVCTADTHTTVFLCLQYLFFFLHLSGKPETDYTAQESYVNQKLEDSDISFFPNQKAMVLPDEEEDDQLQSIASKLDAISNHQRSLISKVDALEKKLQQGHEEE